MSIAPHPFFLQILERIRESGLSLERQMHLFFLVNDVLFRALAERPAPGTPEDADPVALAFRPHLGLMAQSIFSRPDATDADRQQLRKMLSFWGEQGIFSLRTLGDVDEVMRTPRGHVPPSLRARAMPPPPQPAMSPQQVQPIPQPSTGVNWGPPVASAPRPSGGNWGVRLSSSFFVDFVQDMNMHYFNRGVQCTDSWLSLS